MPLVVSENQRNALRVLSCCSAARSAGVRLGESLADVRARLPGIRIEEEVPALTAGLLSALADWCDRYTPLVALQEPDGLLLDITGCAHLFGGEAKLLQDCLARLGRQGIHVRGGIADTPGTAWAEARYGNGGVVAAGEQSEALHPLPLAALRLSSDTLEDMERVGLTRVADIIDRPRAPLARRFGSDLILRLDQALGRVGEPVSPRLPVPLVVAERRFFEPLGRMDDVLAVCRSLAGQLEEALERRCEGGRIFDLAMFRVDGAVQRLQVGTSRPQRQAGSIVQLFADKLKADEGALDIGYGYDLLRLCVLEAQVFAGAQTDFAGGLGEDEAASELFDRLGARLGLSRVTRLLPVDRHLPEVQTAYVPAVSVKEEALAWPPVPGQVVHMPWQEGGLTLTPLLGDATGDVVAQAGAETEIGAGIGTAAWQPDWPLTRPLRLLQPAERIEVVAMVPDGPPLRFRWRRVLYKVVRSEGPERIAPPWWVGGLGPRSAAYGDGTRDYFRVEESAGRRFWLFRGGLYERETLTPAWYLQGIFP